MSQCPRSCGLQQADQTLGSPLCVSTRPPLDPALSEQGAASFFECVSPALNSKPIESVTQRFYHFTLKTLTMAFPVIVANQEFPVGASWLMEILLHGCRERKKEKENIHLKDFIPPLLLSLV